MATASPPPTDAVAPHRSDRSLLVTLVLQAMKVDEGVDGTAPSD